MGIGFLFAMKVSWFIYFITLQDFPRDVTMKKTSKTIFQILNFDTFNINYMFLNVWKQEKTMSPYVISTNVF